MAAIWHAGVDIDALNALHENTAVARLGIVMLEAGADFLRGSMPVDERTVQIHGLLHGGASVLLAETLGSAAANHAVDQALYYCVGTSISANHLRGARAGVVEGVARAEQRGRRTQVWNIEITQDAALICVARLGLQVLAVA